MPPLQANLDELTLIFATFERESGIAVYSPILKLGDVDAIRACLLQDASRLCDQGKLVLNEHSRFERVKPPAFEGRPTRSVSTADMFILNGPYSPLGAIARRLARRNL
jgi:hypothetical protein